MRRLSFLLALAVLLPAPRAWALGEVITDVRVQNAGRTEEETVRSISGLSIGDLLQADTLDLVRERLHTSGLFAEVNVYWEPHQDGVRINIVIKEKFPWAPVPTFSYSPGNISAGGVIAHGNLFGRGKRGVLGGRISTADSGAIVAYDDPALFGSWIFFTLKGRFQAQVIPEYSNRYDEERLQGMPLIPVRNTKLRSWGGDVNLGVAWWRKVRTSVGWSVEQNEVRWSTSTWTDPASPEPGRNPWAPQDLPAAASSARRGSASANVTFDFRARQHAVMYGNSLGFNLEHAHRRWGSDANQQYWKASAVYEHGFRFFRRHNLLVKAGGFVGDNLPLWAENSAGGTNLRGYLYRQFQGDTHLRTQVEYHFPLFSLWSLDVRGVLFEDAAAIWFRKLPAQNLAGTAYDLRADGRQFLPPELLRPGFDYRQDVHSSAGAGVRFYLRSVAVPLVGVDVGNGLGTRDVRVILIVGA